MKARGARPGFRFASPALRKGRKEQGVGLNDLAACLDIPPSTLSRIESGRLRVSPERQELLAVAVNADVDELFQPLEIQPLEARDREIAQSYRCGVRTAELADRYGLDRSTVGRVIDRQGVRRTRGLDSTTIDEIVERYERGDSGDTIAAKAGIPRSTVFYHLRQRGIERRPPAVPWKHPTPSPRSCRTCGQEFTPTGYQVALGWGRFCSRACARMAERVAEPEERTCTRKGCGRTFTPWPSEAVRPGHGQFCSYRCRGLHLWWANEGAGVAGFVTSLRERGLWRGRAQQKWPGRWNGSKGAQYGILGFDRGRDGGRPPAATSAEAQEIWRLWRANDTLLDGERRSPYRISEMVFGDRRFHMRVRRLLGIS